MDTISTHDEHDLDNSVVEESLPQADSLQITGFFRRVAAFLIDMAIIAIPLLIIGFVFRDIAFQLGPWGRLVGFTLVLIYRTILDSSIGNGQTIGKRIMSIAVVDAMGTHLSLPRSFLRALLLGLIFLLNGWGHPILKNPYIAAFATVIIFGGLLGMFYGLIFNRSTRQGLHDLLVGSYVALLPKDQKTHSKTAAATSIPAYHKWITYSFVAVGLVVAGWGLWTAPNAANVAKLVGIEPDEWAEMEDLQKQLESNSDYFTVGVQRNTQRNLNNDTSVTILQITLWAKQSCSSNDNDCEVMAHEAIKKVLAEYDTIDRIDLIKVIVSNHFDLGMATGNITRQFTGSVESWLDEFGQTKA